jgi:hypothetical protein
MPMLFDGVVGGTTPYAMNFAERLIIFAIIYSRER